MNTQTSNRQHSDHRSLLATGAVGDFVAHESETGMWTDRIASIETVNGVRVIIVEGRNTSYLSGRYLMSIGRTINRLHPNGGRTAGIGGPGTDYTTEPEPMSQDRMRELHAELLTR